MAYSKWKDINNHLKSKLKDIEVYSPGIKTGDCLKPYVVIRADGLSQHGETSSNDRFYSVMCYVPRQNYSLLEDLVHDVKEAMKELEPMIKSNNYESPSYYDDAIKAHMISIGYKNYIRR